MTSAPAARILSASFAVSPTPSAAFSPLTMQNEAPTSSRIDHRRDSSARRPGMPTTSAMKRMTSADSF
jgi:hypothetical protein